MPISNWAQRQLILSFGRFLQELNLCKSNLHWDKVSMMVRRLNTRFDESPPTHSSFWDN